MTSETIVDVRREESHGYWLTYVGDTIFAVQAGELGWRVQLGQRVVSNGRFGPMAGTIGYVIELLRPFESGRTTNIIRVIFLGPNNVCYLEHMKFKDLDSGEEQ